MGLVELRQDNEERVREIETVVAFEIEIGVECEFGIATARTEREITQTSEVVIRILCGRVRYSDELL